MAKKVLALNTEGNITYCSVEPENRGKGHCNHIAHQNPGESIEDFVNRIDEKQKALQLEKELNESEEKEKLESHEKISQEKIDELASKIDEIAGEKLDLDNFKKILNKLTPEQMNEIVSLSFDAAPKFSLPISDERYEDENIKNKLYFANLPEYGIGNTSAIKQMFDKVGDVPTLDGIKSIENSYENGLTPEEYFTAQFGARDALINKGVSTSKPGYCIWENSNVQIKDKKTGELKSVLWSDIKVGDTFADDSTILEIQPWQYKKCYELKMTNSEKIILSHDHLVFGEIYVSGKLVDYLEESERCRKIIGESDPRWICISDIFEFYNMGADIRISSSNINKIDYINEFDNGNPVKVRCISTNSGFYQTNDLIHHNTARKLFYAMSDTMVVEDCGGPYIDAMHCNMPEGHVCEKCAHLTQGGERIKEGMLVGGWISTNMSEALTQLSMKQKHVGGTQIKKQLNTSNTIMSTLDGWSTSHVIQDMQKAQTTEEMRQILHDGLRDAYASANIKQDEFNLQMVARKLTSYKRENGRIRPINPGEKADVISIGTLGNANNIFKVSELTSGYKHLTVPTKQKLGKDAANQILR